MGEDLEERVKVLEKRVAQCVAWIEQTARHDLDEELIACYGGYTKEKLEEKVKAIFPD